MPERFEITFASLGADPEAVAVILAGEGLDLGSKARELEAKSAIGWAQNIWADMLT